MYFIYIYCNSTFINILRSLPKPVLRNVYLMTTTTLLLVLHLLESRAQIQNQNFCASDEKRGHRGPFRKAWEQICMTKVCPKGKSGCREEQRNTLSQHHPVVPNPVMGGESPRMSTVSTIKQLGFSLAKQGSQSAQILLDNVKLMVDLWHMRLSMEDHQLV